MAIFGWAVCFIIGTICLLWGVAVAFIVNAFSGRLPIESGIAVIIAVGLYTVCYLTCPFSVVVK